VNVVSLVRTGALEATRAPSVSFEFEATSFGLDGRERGDDHHDAGDAEGKR